MKIIFILALPMLAGCGAFSRLWTNVTGDLTYKCSKSGVEYVQSDSGLTPHYNKDGSLIECK